jgi:uncharacterized protein YggE
MRRALLLLPLLALPAAAQTGGAPPGGAETVLRLSETGTAERVPDELAISLRAEARNASAPAAQEAVNRAMSAALERARSAPAVQAGTGRASAWRQERSGEWQVSQILNLRSTDAAALLALVGQLQQAGLVISDTSWRLTERPRREAREEATREALALLRARAELVARELGMRVLAIREISLDGTEHSRPMPRAAMAAPMAAAAPAPPVAQADEVTVSVTASGVVALAP